MATEKILNTRIVLKNDTLANWNSSSIILKKGEIALALVEVNQKDPVSGQLVKVPTYLTKVGDGSKTFANLNWTAAMAADVYDWAKQASLYGETESLTTTVEDKTYTGNAITKAEWDATLNGGKGGLKFTKETQFATKAELDAAIGVFEGDIGSITDTDTKYTFSYGEGNEAGQLKIVATTYTNGVADATDTKYVDIVTPDELAEELKKYYTKTEVDNELKKYAKLSGESDITVGDGDSVHTKIGTNKIILASGEEYHVTLAADTTEDLDDVLSLVSKSNSSVIVRGVSTPIADNDAANKKYVDDVAEDLLGMEDDDDTYYTIYGAHAAAAAAEAAAKKHADDNEKDTKTVVAKSGDYINVSGPSVLVENGTNTYTVSLNESAIKGLIASETTAAMEFKGATATLPTGTLNKGDMYKVSGQIVVAAANDAQGTGFTAKVGDSIVYDGSKWYHIPSGDDVEDTWRPITIADTELGDDSLILRAGSNVSIATDGQGDFTIESRSAVGDNETIEISSQPDHLTDVLSVKAGGIKNTHIANDAAIAHTKISGLGTMATKNADDYKKVQTAVTDPTASGKSLTFIDTISQDAQGKITVTKKNVNLDNYKTKQTAVTNKITDAAHVLTSLTQTANGEIAYEVKKLTPADIGAQPAGDYATAAQGAKADTAIQSVTCTANSGLKATKSGTAVTIDWDTAVTLVFDCGSSTTVL